MAQNGKLLRLAPSEPAGVPLQASGYHACRAGADAANEDSVNSIPSYVASFKTWLSQLTPIEPSQGPYLLVERCKHAAGMTQEMGRITELCSDR